MSGTAAGREEAGTPATDREEPLAAVEAAAAAASARGKPWERSDVSPTIAPRSSGPTFSWRQLGTYLLSERTLHSLLALGTFLILASGVVISTLNPTGITPLPHLGVVAATTAIFYAVGYWCWSSPG